MLTGLIWFGAQDFESYKSARHACDQGDGLVYTFTEHDGRGSGVQVIKDERNNVELTMSFLKIPAEQSGEPAWSAHSFGQSLLNRPPRQEEAGESGYPANRSSQVRS